jgi:hypothetical protein
LSAHTVGRLQVGQDRTHLVAEAEDDPGQLLRTHQLEIRSLALWVVLTVTKDQRVAAFADPVLGAQGERWEVRVGDVRDDQSQRERAAPDQALGNPIGSIAQALDDRFDAQFAGEDVGHGADRDIRRARDIADGDTALARLALRRRHAQTIPPTHGCVDAGYSKRCFV